MDKWRKEETAILKERDKMRQEINAFKAEVTSLQNWSPCEEGEIVEVKAAMKEELTKDITETIEIKEKSLADSIEGKVDAKEERWVEFGKSSATETYGSLPAANVPPPYALASVSSVKFDRSGHRFATSAIDGTVCTWQLEVGGRSNVHPTDSCLCFDRHASDVAFVGGSGGIVAATGASQNNCNLVFWDTLAPVSTAQAFVYCHEGGARCLEMFDQDVGGGSISSLIVTCGKGGDVAVHDFRYIATGKTKRAKNSRREHGSLLDDQSLRRQQDGELNVDGSVWYIAKAHSGSITCVSAVPGTSLFFTGSKDGDVKLWDVNKCELVSHWHHVHDKRMFLQHNARGFGAVVQQETRGFGGIFQAAVTDVKPVSLGFLTCGGDGILRLFRKNKAAAM
ncbi:hypothetical protein L7F22_066957 [Adiantum nelumboides]|nr:hypothetical protein [Adiantum nelumboides]